MKKTLILFAAVIFFSSCLNNNEENFNYKYQFLKIDEYTVPNSFTFGQKDTIKIKYTIKKNCALFNNIYYEYQDTARVVAVRSILYLDRTCQDSIQKNYNIIVTATQEEDYVFKFWKGKDSNGDNIFEEAVVPVN